MAPTNRTAEHVILDALLDTTGDWPHVERLLVVGQRAQVIIEALEAEGWLRSPAERFAAHMTPSTRADRERLCACGHPGYWHVNSPDGQAIRCNVAGCPGGCSITEPWKERPSASEGKVR